MTNFIEELVPYSIIFTLIICSYLIKKVDKKNIYSIDGILALIGFIFGILMLFMNLKYISKNLILLSPVIAIASLFYLVHRKSILNYEPSFNLNFKQRDYTIIQILYYVCLNLSLIVYYLSQPYYRSPLFFIIISAAVALLGLETVSTKKSMKRIYLTIINILVLSFILRYTGYFISPYPVGSDNWAHAEYIKDFLKYQHLMVTPGIYEVNEYYTRFPVMHLLSCAVILIGNVTVKQSLFICGITLIFSTLFTYLIVKKITNSVNLALLSMLFINFADCNLEWGIQVIAMTFGLAIYSIILYIFIERNSKNKIIFSCLSVLYFFVIVWTHTISAFVLLILMLVLLIMPLLYTKLYNGDYYSYKPINITACVLFFVLLIYHWMNPIYPFLDMSVERLTWALKSEASFLDTSMHLNIVSEPGILFDPIGFLIYLTFGIIGTLYFMSKKHANKHMISLIGISLLLYSIRYGFPILGMNTVIPYRWSAFAIFSFIPLITVGFSLITHFFQNRRTQISFILVILFVSSFFMITDSYSNIDSPIFSKEDTQRNIWTASEMALITNINNSYEGLIVTDSQTESRAFRTYLARKNVMCYELSSDKKYKLCDMNNSKILIWRSSYLDRPAVVGINGSKTSMLLGVDFLSSLDSDLSCIYDTKGAKAYFQK